MATPPNFSGYPYSDRDARRQAKAYARTQRDAWRTQNYYGRMYRRRSILGPVVLLSVGLIALLIETDRISAPAFWNWYSQWWPLLIIGMGLVLLAEYFVDRNNPVGGRRRVGGLVFLVILLASLGYSADGMRNWDGLSRDWSDKLGYDNGNGFFSMLGEEHENQVEMTQAVKPDALIEVENAHGDVTLAASTDNAVHVEAHQIVHGSDNDAKRGFDETRPKLLATASGANVIVAARDGASVDLTISVPPGSSANIRTTHGDMTIAGVKRVDVNQSHGDVKVDDVSGNVHVQIDHGDVTAHGVTGDVDVDGHADDVSLSDVKGRATLNGEFFGDIRFEQIGSAVHFHSSRTDLMVPKLAGEISFDSGDLSISGPSGGLALTTRSKDIEVTGLVGDARIENSNGDVNVTAASLGNVQVTAGTGEVTMTVPANASFSVDASTGKGEEIQTDFPLSTNYGDGERSLRGQVGQGGPKLILRAEHGELSLRKGGEAEALIPQPPEPPAPPKLSRHLKAGSTPPPEPSVQ
jgi:DUF4097 and DUF4098 domain-containing protein YvlB